MVTIEKDDTEWKKDRWRKGENGRRVISSEQPCGVWSRKLARQQRKLYFTDTMRETPQWESCREHACTTLSSACRIKASSHFKIHPWKGGKGGYDLHTLNNRNKEQKTLSGEMLLMETFSTCLLTIKKKRAVALLCLSNTLFGCSRRLAQHLGDKRTGGREMSQVPNPVVFSFSNFHSVFIFCFILLPLVHLSLGATRLCCVWRCPDTFA